VVLTYEAIILITSILAWFGLYLIVNLSLNLEFGYTGIPNFGKMLVVAGGAYVVGYLPGRIIFNTMLHLAQKENLDYIADNAFILTQVNEFLSQNPAIAIGIFFLTLVVGAAFGAFLGFIASYPAIRLREEYLAMTLLAMAEVLRVIGYNYKPLIGGTLGVQVPDILAFVPGEARFPIMSIIILGIAALIFLYVNRLVNSPLGRVLRAVRDSEEASETLGKDITRIRIKILVLSSVIGAIGGTLHALYTGGVISLTYDRVTWTFWPWVMVLLGGMANNVGVMLGTLVFVATRQLITFYKSALAPYLPFDVVWLDYLMLGSALLIILMYRPEGVLPEKPSKTINFSEIANRQLTELRPVEERKE